MKVAWLSDADLIGSGYVNLSIPLCTGLANRGHEVKWAALGYSGAEHNYPFSLIPAAGMQDGMALIENYYNLQGFDALVVALDIPIQEQIWRLMSQKPPFKYVGIMPVEADPLCISWAMTLMQMDKVFIISEFGTQEAKKVGVEKAEHIQLGIDTTSWRFPTPEERTAVRKAMGFDENTFAVLTVADNQERKNLAHIMEVFAKFAEDKPHARWVLVTREHNMIGWRLRDLAQEFGITNKFIILERGMEFIKLWSVFTACDLFFLGSKAEGLGLPLMEAMAVGLPAMATDCTGMRELLAKGRGRLVPYDYIHRDPFGNGRRYWIDKDKALLAMNELYDKITSDNQRLQTTIKKARDYVEERKWEIAVDQLERGLLELLK